MKFHYFGKVERIAQEVEDLKNYADFRDY